MTMMIGLQLQWNDAMGAADVCEWMDGLVEQRILQYGSFLPSYFRILLLDFFLFFNY